MKEKITWDKIYKDFKLKHPRLSKDVVKWNPHDYLTIIVYIQGGMKLTYNYFEHRATILSPRWTHDEL